MVKGWEIQILWFEIATVGTIDEWHPEHNECGQMVAASAKVIWGDGEWSLWNAIALEPFTGSFIKYEVWVGEIAQVSTVDMLTGEKTPVSQMGSWIDAHRYCSDAFLARGRNIIWTQREDNGVGIYLSQAIVIQD